MAVWVSGKYPGPALSILLCYLASRVILAKLVNVFEPLLVCKMRKIIILPYRAVVNVKCNNVCEDYKTVPGAYFPQMIDNSILKVVNSHFYFLGD